MILMSSYIWELGAIPMKYLAIISVLLILTQHKCFAQETMNIDDVKQYLLDLPLQANKETIVKAAKANFKNNTIDSFVIQSNTKVYFEDTAISYDYFHNKPLLTTLKIFDIWSGNNSINSDTAFYITIDASYGFDNKGERRMMSEYNSLKSAFSDQFSIQRPYTMYAEGKIAEGLNFFTSDKEKIPPFNIGWSNGGCLRDYHVTISYRRKT